MFCERWIHERRLIAVMEYSLFFFCVAMTAEIILILLNAQTILNMNGLLALEFHMELVFVKQVI